MSNVSPFRHYRIVTETVLSPVKKYEYLEYLRNRGWIHTNTNKRRSPHREFDLLEIDCTPEHLGKVVSYVLSQEGWVIVEQIK